ncbi:MAG: sialidase family protein, partial [Candidatus Kapaibacterium sp.]
MKAIILLLLFTVSANAELRNVVQINDNQNPTAQKSPSVTVDQDGNIYSIWIDYRDNKLGEIFLSKSLDNGKIWSKNKFIFGSDIPNSKFQRYATIKSHGNNLYICWMSTINAQIDVFFCKSTDNGNSFTNPIVVSDDNNKYNQDFPVMNVDDNGGIHIAAIDNRNLQKGNVSFAELMYTHSTDEGETWSANKMISTLNENAGACECCWPGLDTYTDNEGNVTVSVLYRSNIDNLRVSYLAN